MNSIYGNSRVSYVIELMRAVHPAVGCVWRNSLILCRGTLRRTDAAHYFRPVVAAKNRCFASWTVQCGKCHISFAE
jgi:hypothetical protein